MNERIEKLWNKAKQSHADEVTDGDLSILNLESPFVQIDIRKKFAELIVRECIDILPEKVKIDDLYDGRILVQCGMAIKEHFGVEDAPVNDVDRILQTVRTRGQK